MIHELKIDPKYFAAVRSGEKRFELRRNDRDFCVGDYLALNEYDRATKAYTGRTELVRVDYTLNPNDIMTCPGDFVVMSIVRKSDYDSAGHEEAHDGQTI